MSKKVLNCIIPKSADCCPSCKNKLKEMGVKLLYKDFVECNECGHMWITRHIEQVSRFR